MSERFSKKEAAQRTEAALRAAFSMSKKPREEMKVKPIPKKSQRVRKSKYS